MSTKKLTSYQDKRDSSHTPEPYDSESSTLAHPLFVVQQHAARSMHYDFRLEDNGVLRSWAIPKGPSTDPHEKQLALETEDHYLEYAHFEGIIPAGSYGAGKVIIWDRGSFKNIKPETILTAYQRGEILVELQGEKLQGNFALIRTNYQGRKAWLLIKMKDDLAQPGYSITKKQPQSIISGKTIGEFNEK